MVQRNLYLITTDLQLICNAYRIEIVLSDKIAIFILRSTNVLDAICKFASPSDPLPPPNRGKGGQNGLVTLIPSVVSRTANE